MEPNEAQPANADDNFHRENASHKCFITKTKQKRKIQRQNNNCRNKFAIVYE